jgi:hypothetical protein
MREMASSKVVAGWIEEWGVVRRPTRERSVVRIGSRLIYML